MARMSNAEPFRGVKFDSFEICRIQDSSFLRDLLGCHRSLLINIANWVRKWIFAFQAEVLEPKLKLSMVGGNGLRWVKSQKMYVSLSETQAIRVIETQLFGLRLGETQLRETARENRF